MKFSDWFAHSPIASILRTAFAVFLGLAVTDWSTGGMIAFDRWQTWAIGAAVSVLPALTRWINPADSAFGDTRKDS